MSNETRNDPGRTEPDGGELPCMAHLVDDDGRIPSDRTSAGATVGYGDAELANLVRALADAVVISDVNGTITYWNEAAERVFGWTAAHAVGKSLDLIIPERQRRAHWEGYERVMASGRTRYGDDLLRVPSLHADGERHSIAFTVTLLFDTDGAVSGIAAVVRDETERWAAERELRRKAAAAEG